MTSEINMLPKNKEVFVQHHKYSLMKTIDTNINIKMYWSIPELL